MIYAFFDVTKDLYPDPKGYTYIVALEVYEENGTSYVFLSQKTKANSVEGFLGIFSGPLETAKSYFQKAAKLKGHDVRYL